MDLWGQILSAAALFGMGWAVHAFFHRKEHEELKEQVGKKQKLINESKRQVQEISAEPNKLKAEVTALTAKCSQLEESYELLRGQKREISDMYQTTMVERTELQRQNNELRIQIERLSEEDNPKLRNEMGLTNDMVDYLESASRDSWVIRYWEDSRNQLAKNRLLQRGFLATSPGGIYIHATGYEALDRLGKIPR